MGPKKDRTRNYQTLEASSPSFRLKQRILEHTLAEILPVPVERAWDAGCGAGTLSAIVARHTGGELRVTDIEASSVRATVGRLAALSRPAVRGDVFDLERDEMPPAGFDFVLSWAVLEHLADDARGMSTLARALAPGGRMVLNVPLHPRLMNQLDHLEDHHRRYTRRSLTRLVEDAGLRVVRFRVFGFPGLLATKILWAPFARHEAAAARSPWSRLLARGISSVDFAAYRAGSPFGVEALVVAESAVTPAPATRPPS